MYGTDGERLKEQLFEVLRQEGAALMGIGDMRGVVAGACQRGVSVAVPVPGHIVEDLKTAPTMEYYHAYASLNAALDAIVEAGARFLREKGYAAHANSTQTVHIDEAMRTALPHKSVAYRAGLGWIGKSGLLITQAYGGAVRLSSLLSDAPLPTAAALPESRCGSCAKCVEACPAGALTGRRWEPGLERDAIFDWAVCKRTQEARMKAATGIETDLCGLCFAVCPFTQRYLKGNEAQG